MTAENPLGRTAAPIGSALAGPSAVDVEGALAELAEVSPESVGVFRRAAEALATQQDAAAASAFALLWSTPTNWHQVCTNVNEMLPNYSLRTLTTLL
jgi:hypothetical protein